MCEQGKQVELVVIDNAPDRRVDEPGWPPAGGVASVASVTRVFIKLRRLGCSQGIAN